MGNDASTGTLASICSNTISPRLFTSYGISSVDCSKQLYCFWKQIPPISYNPNWDWWLYQTAWFWKQSSTSMLSWAIPRISSGARDKALLHDAFNDDIYVYRKAKDYCVSLWFLVRRTSNVPAEPRTAASFEITSPTSKNELAKDSARKHCTHSVQNTPGRVTDPWKFGDLAGDMVSSRVENWMRSVD